MHQDTTATAADWPPYCARQSFNLFELAALLYRQDPERLVSAVLREQHKRNQELDRGREFETPAMILGMVQAMPEAMLGDDVGALLRRLQKALGVQSLQTSVSLERAQSLASLLGLEWPPELRAAGAHPMGRFQEGRAAATTPTEAAPAGDDDDELAGLFDPVRVATLEALFPDGGKWAKHAERAARNRLIAARVARGKFNLYRAARWWMETQAPAGWKWERCARVLANNLPPRSRDCGHLLTGDFD